MAETNQPTPVILSDAEVNDIEKRRYAAVRSYHSGDDVNWFLTVGIPALCQTVRALRAMIPWHRDGVGPDVPVLQERYDNLIATNTDLREQLAEAAQTLRLAHCCATIREDGTCDGCVVSHQLKRLQP